MSHLQAEGKSDQPEYLELEQMVNASLTTNSFLTMNSFQEAKERKAFDKAQLVCFHPWVYLRHSNKVLCSGFPTDRADAQAVGRHIIWRG